MDYVDDNLATMQNFRLATTQTHWNEPFIERVSRNGIFNLSP